MHIENQPDTSHARKEFQLLYSTYKELGFEVHLIEQKAGLPDMVYTANIGNVHNNTFIPANFMYPERRGEVAPALDYLVSMFDFEVERVPEELFFEGQGDLLTDGSRYFFGWGKRSSYAAKEHLERIIGAQIHDFELVDPYYYHLDTCFAPLKEGMVLINPRSFTPEGLNKIYSLFDTVIETNEQDNSIIGCNLVVAGSIIVIGKGTSEETQESLRAHGFSLREIPMEEYRKGGGSVKCCTFEF